MSTLIILVAVVLGIVFGYVFQFKNTAIKIIDSILLLCLYFLLFTMGLKIGLNQQLLNSLPTLGLKSLAISILTIAFSVGCVIILEKIFLRNARVNVYYSEDEKKKNVHSKLSYKIIMCVIAGIGAGVIFKGFEKIAPKLDLFSAIALNLMIFTSSIGIGSNKQALQSLKTSGKGLLIVPAGILIGSLLGGFVAAPLVGLSFAKSVSIGACMGWYTLGGATLGAVDGSLGIIAFMANLMRELLAIIIIPIVAKRFGSFAAIAPAGSTAMDTNLAIVVRSTTQANMIIAFSTGIVLSIVTPVLLGIIIGLF